MSTTKRTLWTNIGEEYRPADVVRVDCPERLKGIEDMIPGTSGSLVCNRLQGHDGGHWDEADSVLWEYEVEEL